MSRPDRDEEIFAVCAADAVERGLALMVDGQPIVPPETMARLLRERGREDLAVEVERAAESLTGARSAGLDPCPACGDDGIMVDVDDEGRPIVCNACGQTFDGSMPAADQQRLREIAKRLRDPTRPALAPRANRSRPA